MAFDIVLFNLQNNVMLGNRLDVIRKHCSSEQEKREKKIMFIALLIGTISFVVFCFLTQIFTAISIAGGLFILSAALPRADKFPGNQYSEIIDILGKNNNWLTHFDYDFFKFAEEKGILTPKTIVGAYQLFKDHKAFIAKTARIQEQI